MEQCGHVIKTPHIQPGYLETIYKHRTRPLSLLGGISDMLILISYTCTFDLLHPFPRYGVLSFVPYKSRIELERLDISMFFSRR